MLKSHMPSLNDVEDSTVPAGLPAIIDTHVHIFPRNIFSAVWKWFDDNGWHIRYQFSTSEIFEFLLSHGIKHIIAFQYAHKPGMANMLNTYMVEKCSQFSGRVSGLATVYPGEERADKLLQESFDSGLAGLKLHAHVQCFDMACDDMYLLYECCRKNNKPVVMHVGREPKSSAYHCDPYMLCNVGKVENVLKDFPNLKICVPHLGIDEVSAYKNLIEEYDNLWLDTAMAVADYLPIKTDVDLSTYRTDRIMYGSDFPNIPYAWDRELKILKDQNLSDNFLENFFYKNAIEFYGLNFQKEK